MSSDKLAQALRTLADNPDDLRCAQWVIANGSAKRRDGDE